MIFGLFKDNNKKVAEAVYGNFRAPINVAKKLGKWDKHSTFGETFVYDDYLLGFFNLYIQDFAKIAGLKTTQDRGRMMHFCFKLLDERYSKLDELNGMINRYTMKCENPTKDFKLATNHAAMVISILMDDQAQRSFSKDPIFKEATKYFSSGKFNKDIEFARELMPKEDNPAASMSSAPTKVIIANRVFTKTFTIRLNKTFKVKGMKY